MAVNIVNQNMSPAVVDHDDEKKHPVAGGPDVPRPRPSQPCSSEHALERLLRETMRATLLAPEVSSLAPAD